MERTDIAISEFSGIQGAWWIDDGSYGVTFVLVTRFLGHLDLINFHVDNAVIGFCLSWSDHVAKNIVLRYVHRQCVQSDVARTWRCSSIDVRARSMIVDLGQAIPTG